MDELRFPYKPKVAVFLFATLFFAACALGLGYMALTNDRGLILNRIIEFSTDAATIFYWCLAAASALFVIVGSLGLYSGFTSRKEIVLTQDAITSPKSAISKKIVTVNFSDITDVNIQSVQKQHFLNILHPNGKLTIAQGMLPNRQTFEELASSVAARVDY